MVVHLNFNTVCLRFYNIEKRVIMPTRGPCSRTLVLISLHEKMELFQKVVIVEDNCCLNEKFTGDYDLGSTEGSRLHKVFWEIIGR